jgi:hypothetical protein
MGGPEFSADVRENSRTRSPDEAEQSAFRLQQLSEVRPECHRLLLRGCRSVGRR